MKKKYLITILSTIVFTAAILIAWNPWETGGAKYAYIPSALIDSPSTVSADLLRARGIDPVPFVTGRETVQALMGGAASVATLAEWPFLLASNERNDLRVLAVITSAQSMGILADRGAGIASPEDLVERAVGFPQGTSAQFLFESYFNEKGILAQVKRVNLPPPQLQSALLRGDLQAIAIWQPFLEKARQEDPDNLFYLPGSQQAFRVVYCVVSTQQNIDENPGELVSVLESLIEGEKALNTNSPEAISRLAQATGLEHETLIDLLPLFRFEVVLSREIIDTWEKLAVWAHSSGLASESVLTRDWMSFIHTETLQKLDPSRVRF